MLANAMASELAANSRSPRRPRKNMETAERRQRTKAATAIGKASVKRVFASVTASDISGDPKLSQCWRFRFVGCSKVLIDKRSRKISVRDCWFSVTAVPVPVVVVVDELHMTVVMMMKKGYDIFGDFDGKEKEFSREEPSGVFEVSK